MDAGWIERSLKRFVTRAKTLFPPKMGQKYTHVACLEQNIADDIKGEGLEVGMGLGFI